MTRCMGCMREYDDGLTVCPHCGYRQGASAREAYHLPPETILNGRYLVSRVRDLDLTSQFPAFIQRHGMKKIRFHDLRHSCASLLLTNGVPPKQIQDWLGHSDFSTTANIYAYLDYSSKLSSAQMVCGMPLPEAGDFGSRWEQNAEKSGG